MSSSGSYGESLAWSSLLARCLGLSLPDLVGVNSVKEILPALGVLDVLDTDVDSLGEDLATDTLVDHDNHGSLGHVEHTPGLAVVGLVWHTLLEGTTALDINNVTNLVELEVSGQMLNTLLLVGSREHVPGATTVSCRVCHLLAVSSI